MRRCWAPLPAVVLALAGATEARADSGAITEVRAAGGGEVRARYTATATTCAAAGVCGWFPYAVQVRGDAACDASTDLLTYVGDFIPRLGTQEGADHFAPAWPLLRICLYIRRADATNVLVGQATWPAGAEGPPAAAPTAPTRAATLSAAQARAAVTRVLRRRFGSRWTSGRGFERRCARVSAAQMRCRVRWRTGADRYAGTLLVTAQPPGARDPFVVTGTVRPAADRSAGRFPAKASG